MKGWLNTKNIACTGILLAVCVVFQLLKGVSVYITGPVVNACLILATFALGLPGGAIIAVLTPFIAWIIGATPILNLIPLMLPVIMIGNFILVYFAWLYSERDDGTNIMNYLILGIGAVLKSVFLWLMVALVMLPVFGKGIPAPQQSAMRTMFSITQYVTAMIGIILALPVWSRLRKLFDK